MAIVAGGDRVVTAFRPGVELLGHDMTIRAGRGVVLEIRGTVRVEKRIDPDAARDPEQNGAGDPDSSQGVSRD